MSKFITSKSVNKFVDSKSENKFVNSKYGEVIIDKKSVIKCYGINYFDIMIREYAVSNLLKNFEGIVVSNDIDFVNFRITMDNHGINLKNWINTKKINTKDKKTIFQQIIKGIAHMHSYGVMHGDIKLENIVINKSLFGKISIHIIDLSHTNLIEYVDVNLTSPVYQEPVPFCGTSHDMWSVGITALELYNEKVLNIAPSMEQIAILLDIIPLEMQSTIRDMLQIDKNKRITALESLTRWKCNTLQCYTKVIPVIHYTMIAEGYDFAAWYCKETLTNEVVRKEYGLAALIHFINKNEIPVVHYNIYFIGMLVILTSLFTGQCTLEWAIKTTEYNDLMGVIRSIVIDHEVINMLYTYNDSIILFKEVISKEIK